ncbi:MAG: hypothetical protein WD688_00410 [Candidatus Binatia bacterium]
MSHEGEPELENNLLRRIRMVSPMVVIESTYNRYELDISHVNPEEVAEACAILHKMNFDKSFTVEVV